MRCATVRISGKGRETKLETRRKRDDVRSVSGYSDGDPADPAPVQETEYAICRAVRNGSGQVVRLQGGTEYRFSYVLYLPAGTPALKLGTPVRVYSRQGNERVASGCVADFVSGPLGCKLWI